MSGSLEESAPLVDAPASLTATDRAQHQSRRSSLSLKTTLAVGSACALLVGAAIVSSVNSARDASVQPLGARARSAKASPAPARRGRAAGGTAGRMTGRFPRASTSADASGAHRRRGHPTDPAQPPSSSPARLFAPRRSRPRSSSVSRARRDGMPRPPRTELRGRNGAPIFLRSQFPRQEDVAPIARFPTRAHRAERKVCDSRKTLARAAWNGKDF